jgi:phosphatidylglycerol:prolipoprotein diacylglycerol transferase
MQPEIHLFGLTLQTFGLLFAGAFLASGIVVAKRLGELGKPKDWAYEMVLAAVVGGVVGARGYYLVEHYDEVKNDLIGTIFSGSGLVWYGGLIGGAVAVLLWAYWRGIAGLVLLDLTAPALAIGYAVGRVGCQVSGDGDYGTASDLPWAMAYPNGSVPIDEEVHPTPIYESLAMALVAWLLWQWRDTVQPGVLFAAYLTLAGIERFLVEFIRRNDEVWAGLTLPQFESIGLIVVGLVWLGLVKRGNGLVVNKTQA